MYTILLIYAGAVNLSVAITGICYALGILIMLVQYIREKELPAVNKKLLYEYNSIGGKIKLSTNDIIKAYNDVVNKPTSNYYVSTTIEGSYHNMYSSICNQITQGKDIINRFEKTLLVGMLFNFIKYETNNKA